MSSRSLLALRAAMASVLDLRGARLESVTDGCCTSLRDPGGVWSSFSIGIAPWTGMSRHVVKVAVGLEEKPVEDPARPGLSGDVRMPPRRDGEPRLCGEPRGGDAVCIGMWMRGGRTPGPIRVFVCSRCLQCFDSCEIAPIKVPRTFIHRR